MILSIASGLLYAFSKEKKENEVVAALRLRTLAKSVIVNYIVLLILYVSIYGAAIYLVILLFTFLQLIIFIVMFRIRMMKYNKYAS